MSNSLLLNHLAREAAKVRELALAALREAMVAEQKVKNDESSTDTQWHAAQRLVMVRQAEVAKLSK